MNKNSKIKREKRASLIQQNEDLLTAAEERDVQSLTEEEQRTFDENDEAIEKLSQEIDKLERHEKRMADMEARRQEETRHKRETETPEAKVVKNYRFTRALRSQMKNGGSLDGLEKEVQEEGLKEMRAAGITSEGAGIIIPSMFIGNPESRATMSVGTPATGGHSVATDLQGIIPYLYARTQVETLGARKVTGLVGNLDMMRKTGTTTQSWKGEVVTADSTNPTYEVVNLSPNRLTGQTPVSRQLLMQDSLGIDQDLRQDIAREMAQAVDKASINGSGSSNEPEGILNDSNITTVAIGTNGGAPTRNHLLALENAIDTANADMGNLAYLTTPGIRTKLKSTLLDQGSGKFVWEEKELLNSYRALVSTNVPSNLTKGTLNAIAHAIIFGNWADWWIGQWGGVELIVDEYTLASENQIRLVVHSYWDMYARHSKSFAAVKDADATLS